VTDWPALIQRLEDAGMRHIDIATCCERSENWVGMLKRGIIKQPPHAQGESLLELERNVSRRTQDPAVRLSLGV
jgi:hypothetical protein